ncbi:hypothetical protein FB107DRAFT_273808 [Schizophyllum commune]
MPRPKVSERVSKFKEIFLAKPPLVSGELSLDASNYLLYYGGPQNPRCIGLAKATDAELQALSDACEPATFGVNHTDVYDENYRKARKMDACAFSCKFDPGHLGLLDLLCTEFLSEGREAEDCEGSFFKAHKDTPRSDTMFGSLVVVFPTPHEGGALILRENDKEYIEEGSFSRCNPATKASSAVGAEPVTEAGSAPDGASAVEAGPPTEAASATDVLSGGAPAPKLFYVAFFSDVEHEVSKVTAGFRVTLTYNLYFGAKARDEQAQLLLGRELRSMLKDFFHRKSFLPDGGYLGFGLRFMYPLDPTKPVSVIADSLKGCDAMLKVVCEDLGLPCTLHAMYATTVDEDRGKYYVRRKVYIVRDQFYGETLERRPYKLSDYCDDVYSEKGTLLLRKGREPPIEPVFFDDLDTDEVYWITEVPSQYNTVKSHYMVYGNEAEMKFTYGMLVLLAQVKPYEERKHVSRSTPAPEAQVPEANSEGPNMQAETTGGSTYEGGSSVDVSQ